MRIESICSDDGHRAYGDDESEKTSKRDRSCRYSDAGDSVNVRQKARKSGASNYKIEWSVSCAGQDSSTLSNIDEKECQGGLITSRLRFPVPRAPWRKIFRIKVADTSPNTLPKFENCPEWAKPLMYAEYQVGYPEEWLCSIFNNLPDELSEALRAAYFGVSIVHEMNMQRAQDSFCNRMRQTIRNLFGNKDEYWEVICWKVYFHLCSMISTIPTNEYVRVTCRTSPGFVKTVRWKRKSLMFSIELGLV
mmetsp:Transcript_35742/g.93760  ORF Transcript_35742/g.93760 Transcript_35742/m.93760 type:complete len:249 (-) Transcript_35742:310-1056(-)